MLSDMAKINLYSGKASHPWRVGWDRAVLPVSAAAFTFIWFSYVYIASVLFYLEPLSNVLFVLPFAEVADVGSSAKFFCEVKENHFEKK